MIKDILILLLTSLFLNNLKAQEQEYNPPTSIKIRNQLIIHGDTLVDNYYWMRDKNSSEVINHLYAENAYADNIMKQSNFLQKVLYEEFKSRRKETYTSRSSKRKGYLYYNRMEKGKEYQISCRKKDTINAVEKIVLDINLLAKDMPYLNVPGFAISPNQQWLYYGIDNKGNNILTYYLKHIDTDSTYQTEKIENTLELHWAEDNKTVYYTKPEDKTLRSFRVYRHIIGRPTIEDELIFEELDKTFAIRISKSTSKNYFFITF